MKRCLLCFAVIFVVGSMSAAVMSGDTLTCADAKTKALAGNTDDAVVKGFVTSIATDFSAKHKNISFWMADTQDGGAVFEAYRAVCEKAEDAPVVGSLVWVKGKLTKFKNTPEMAAGCTFGILLTAEPPVSLGEKTIAKFIALKNKKDTCIVSGIVADIVMDKEDATKYNKYGNFYLVEGTDSLYVYGLLTADKQKGKFQEMGVDVGDRLTIKAVYAEFKGKPQTQNAVFVAVEKKTPSGLDNVGAETGTTVKIISNGQLIIEKNGVRYNVTGIQLH